MQIWSAVHFACCRKTLSLIRCARPNHASLVPSFTIEGGGDDDEPRHQFHQDGASRTEEEEKGKKWGREREREKKKYKQERKAEQSQHMFRWPAMTRGRKREPEGPIVSGQQKAALTVTSAVSKADTGSRRGPILWRERGCAKWRTVGMYWYGRVLECSRTCPPVTAPYCMDINYKSPEANEMRGEEEKKVD